MRRRCQLAKLRPDLEIVLLRGNVETRLRKLEAGDCDATILAAAGLERLGLKGRICERLSPEQMLPAVGQGVIGVECVSARAEIMDFLRPLEHGPTRTALDAERAFSARLGGSCQSPIGGYATIAGNELRLRGLVGSPDGRKILRDELTGPARDAHVLGVTLAERMLGAGAEELLRCPA
jgi:hydroxymethylbilane synthase